MGDRTDQSFATFIFDDDGPGEIADVVAIRPTENLVSVTLFHCKFFERRHAWREGQGSLCSTRSSPKVRAVARSTTYWEAGSWIVGIVLVDHYVCGWIRRIINGVLPATVLGGYPEPRGWLHVVDWSSASRL